MCNPYSGAVVSVVLLSIARVGAEYGDRRCRNHRTRRSGQLARPEKHNTKQSAVVGFGDRRRFQPWFSTSHASPIPWKFAAVGESSAAPEGSRHSGSVLAAVQAHLLRGRQKNRGAELHCPITPLDATVCGI